MSASTPNSPYLSMTHRWGSQHGYRILGEPANISMSPPQNSASLNNSPQRATTAALFPNMSACDSPLLRRVQLSRLKQMMMMPKMRITPLQIDIGDDTESLGGQYETLEFVSGNTLREISQDAPSQTQYTNCNAISEPCSPGPPTTSRILKSSTDTKDLPGSRSSCHVQSTRNSFYPIESIGKSQPISESEPSTTAGIVQTKAQTLASAQMVSFHYANTTPSNLISKTKTSSEVAILPPPYPVTTQNNRGPPPPNRSMTPYSLYQFDANTTRWRQFSYPMGNSENHLNSTMSEFDIDSGIRSRSVTDFVDSPMDATYSFQEVREVNITRHEEEKFGMKVDRIGQSLFITMILKSSCASNAGLKVGDEVIRINDKPVNRLPIEEIISLIRGSESTVKIAYKPRAVIARVRDVVLKKVDGRVGIRLQRRADGLFIDVVVENSPAIKAGLKEGDELLRINDRVVIDWSQERATRYLKELPNDCDILLYIREMLPMAHVSGHHGATPCLQLTPNSTPFCFTGPSEPNSPLLAKKSTCGST